MRRTYKRRRDGNDAALAEVAEEEGAITIFVGEPMDWLIVIDGHWFPAEIKHLNGRAYGRKDQLTKQQEELKAIAEENRATFFIWYTAEDVRRDIRAARDAIRRGVKPETTVAMRTTAAG